MIGHWDRDTVGRRLRRAWDRLLGLFSQRRRLAADVFAEIERGDGGVRFAWCLDHEDDEPADADEMIGEVDRWIRRAPAPFGADEFLLRVVVYGSHPDDAQGVEPRLQERRTLHVERFEIDRYYDWKRGDAREQLQALLQRWPPSPDSPVIVVGVASVGSALASLMRQRRWRPVSPWLR